MQRHLFPNLEEEYGALSAKERQLVQTLEVVRVEELVVAPVGRWPGRPQKDRRLVARAFVAKAVYGFATTRALLDALASSPRLRRTAVGSDGTRSRARHRSRGRSRRWHTASCSNGCTPR